MRATPETLAPAGRGRRSRRGARSSPRTSSARPSSPPCPTSSCSRSTRRCGRGARRPRSCEAGRRGSTAYEAPNDRGLRARGRRRLRGAGAARGWLAAASPRARRATCTSSSSSRRCPELGLVAANGPNDPEPELVVENGVVMRMDGRNGGRLRRHRPLRRRARARPRRRRRGDGASTISRSRACSSTSTSRARELVRLSRGLTPGEARARHRAPRPGRAHARAEEAPRAARSRRIRRT